MGKCGKYKPSSPLVAKPSTAATATLRLAALPRPMPSAAEASAAAMAALCQIKEEQIKKEPPYT